MVINLKAIQREIMFLREARFSYKTLLVMRKDQQLKKIAIVQSNYIPWKGYFDLIAAVDEFILLDDAQYTRRDWQRKDIISKSIYDAAGREASLKDIIPIYRGSFIGYLCEKNKSSRVYFIDDAGLEIKGSYTLKELNYNKVVIGYELNQPKKMQFF